MKKILFLALLAFGMSARGQITLEHTFDSASTYLNLPSQLIYVKFSATEENYFNINKEGRCINVYDLNHAFIKKISYSTFPQDCTGSATFLYFSKDLFSNDNLMDYMMITGDCSGIRHTYIYNENGVCIFSADSLAPLVMSNTQQLQYPIYNTSQGTKMILSQEFNGTANLYSVCPA